MLGWLTVDSGLVQHGSRLGCWSRDSLAVRAGSGVFGTRLQVDLRSVLGSILCLL